MFRSPTHWIPFLKEANLFLHETTSERKQLFVKIIKIPIDAVSESRRRRKRRFDPVHSVKATDREVGSIKLAHDWSGGNIGPRPFGPRRIR